MSIEISARSRGAELSDEERKVLTATLVGTTIEWYDFFVYAQAAGLVFGALFFAPMNANNPLLAQIVSFATLGLSFLFRPLGAIVCGHLGDRFGRKNMLVVTLLLMGAATALVGLLPTYAQIGVWAPILLVAMRVIQGLGAGAEYGGAVIYLVENAPPKHRGFWGGFAPLGVSVGNLLAAGAFALVTMLPREALMSWGWRLPFLASFLLIVVGIFVRMRITETPVYTEAVVKRGKVESNPAMEALRQHPRNFFVVLGARMAENGLGYFFPVFGLSYVITTLGVPKAEALSALMLAFTVELFAILGFAALSDRIGRRPVYMFGALAGVALAFPFFWMVGTKEWIMIALAFILARAVVTAAMFGPQAAYFAELFPPQRRFAGFAFARELGSLLSGGPAPFVATALVAAYGTWWPVACYAMFLSACTVVAIWIGPETYQENIAADASEQAELPAAIPARA